jgi:flagellar M-ring protein FliF
VVNSPFTDMEREAVPELPLWRQPEMIELAKQIVKTLLIGALVLYLVLGVLRPMLKRLNEPPPPSPAPLLAESSADEALQSIPAPPQASQLSHHDQRLALARQLARDDPKMVASVIKQWVNHE